MNFSEYDPRKILIHATDYNRTHQSILSELYGMYEGLREAELKDDEQKFTMVNDKYMKDNNTNLFSQIHNELSNIGNKVNSESFPVFNIHKCACSACSKQYSQRADCNYHIFKRR